MHTSAALHTTDLQISRANSECRQKLLTAADTGDLVIYTYMRDRHRSYLAQGSAFLLGSKPNSCTHRSKETALACSILQGHARGSTDWSGSQVSQSLLLAATPVCLDVASTPRDALVTWSLSTRGGRHIQFAPSTTCQHPGVGFWSKAHTGLHDGQCCRPWSRLHVKQAARARSASLCWPAQCSC